MEWQRQNPIRRSRHGLANNCPRQSRKKPLRAALMNYIYSAPVNTAVILMTGLGPNDC